MIPGLLVLSIAAGIVWADTGHALAHWPVATWLIFAGSLLYARRGRVRRPGRTSRSLAGGCRRLSVLGLICAAGLGFIAGFDRLDLELADARRDAERAIGGKAKSLRVAEARVASRRAGRWGDEVELVSVRAVDNAGPLPETLMLRLPESAARQVEAIPARAERLLWPGARVRLGLRISPRRGSRNPGTPDREHQRARRGHAARARLVKPDWVLALSGGAFDAVSLMDRVSRARAAWRRRVTTRLELEGRAGALVGALGLGNRSAIPNSTREAFRRLGLSHLLVVSGLHVGFVAGLAGALFVRTMSWLRWRGGNTLVFDAALGVACATAALYAWLTEAGISVERAALLFGLCAVCRLSLRRLTPAAALAWVAAGMLLMDPAALFDVGAQLSFGACGALIVAGFWKGEVSSEPASKTELGLAARIGLAVSASFRASLGVSLGTAPLLAYHGMALSLLSPLVNVIAIPWLGLLVLPTSLLAVALAEILPGSFFSILMLPARGFEATGVVAAGFLPDPSSGALLALPMLVLASSLALFWMRRGESKKAVWIWIGIALAGSAPSLHGPTLAEPPRVVFFDVGQGDASLIQGREAVLLIDTGSGPADASGGAALVRGLRALGVASIDVLAVTHADLDHRAGSARVLATFPVDELWLPVSGSQDAPLQALSKSAQERGVRVRWLAAGDLGMRRGDLEIEVLWPPAAASSKALSRNESSLVLRVAVDELVILFTADIGAEVEKLLTDSSTRLSADILKVAHHGSRWSSTVAFLEAVSAAVVVVSAPCDPARGLPNAGTLERLRESGASLWWTGREGAVIASRDESGRISVESWGRRRRCRLR